MIRKIKKEEVHKLYPFVYRIFSDMNFSLLETINGDELNAIVLEAMQSPHYRYGYEHAWICENEEGQIQGVLFGYPGELEFFVDGPLEVALVNRGFAAMKLKEGNESLPDSWHIDAVVVAPIFRNQGIGRRLVEIIDNLALDAGHTRISVNIPADSEVAQKLFRQAGFKERTQFMLGRQACIHMIKNL